VKADLSIRKSNTSRWVVIALGGLAIYLLVSYLLIPLLDERKVHRHPGRYAYGQVTRTGTGLPGDPLNIALVGSEAGLARAMLAAGWRPADALGVKSSVRITVDTVLDKPDPDAPVSNLYLFGRREDLAFEKPVGHSPKERHHVRFWKSPETDDGRPVWIGSATHDIGVELSRTTGQVTHHIAAAVDEERDLLVSEITATTKSASLSWIPDYHSTLNGRNGGGDPWHTDGRLAVLTLEQTDP
jgi:hypothetical protein